MFTMAPARIPVLSESAMSGCRKSAYTSTGRGTARCTLTVLLRSCGHRESDGKQLTKL